MNWNVHLMVFAGMTSAAMAWADEANAFRVTPYVQHPAKTGITLMWLAQSGGAASVAWWVSGGATTNTIATATEIQPTERIANSRFTADNALQYCLAPEFGYDRSVEAADNYPAYTREGKSAGWSLPYTVPYQYRVRLTGLRPGTTYGYRVTLAGGATYENVFRTSPDGWRDMRFICYSDSETEPADNPISTGRTTDWTDPVTGDNRRYYATQTEAYASNIAAVVSFKPDLIVMAGDLAQKGSRQCDWDEFWRHNAGPLNDPAGSIPIVASPGNHDYWSYLDGGEAGMRKYISYFEFEPNGAAVDDDIQERFHRVDYGPATFLFLDANNGDDSDFTRDTNRYLARTDADYSPYAAPQGRGCRAPDFNPGTAQYAWLEAQLKDAQQKSAFIFVVSHQCPYSVGDHGQPNVADGASGELLSGRALRVLIPLLHKYGVTAWLAGHDEMMERSTVTGEETLPDGTTRPHTLHIWDMGIAGDGLRGGKKVDNPQEAFRADANAPEVYDADGVLTDGGKHYGHIEVAVTERADGAWVATFDPVYEFFTTNALGEAVFGGTRHYADKVTVVNASTIRPTVRLTAKATGPGGVLRFDDGEAAAEVSCDAARPVTLTAVPDENYVFYRWIGDTDGLDEAAVTRAALTVEPDRAKAYRAVFLRKTGTGTASFIAEPEANAGWFDAANWVGGELPVAGDVVTVAPDEGRKEQRKYTLVLDAPTPRYESVLLNHGSSGGCVLTMTNWTTRLEANTITLGGCGAVTCAGPFAEGEMSNRVWLVCNDFTMKKAQRIKINNSAWTNFGFLSADDKGYKVSHGPGCVKYGAAHGGCGGFLTDQNAGVLAALPYGDEEWPQTAGSGGTLANMVGGGVIRLDVTGTITIEATTASDCINTISACATQSNFTEDKGMGAGGSISISCGRLISKRAVIKATGSDGRTSWDVPERAFSLSLPGGGGRIAIHYDPVRQQVGDVVNTTLSAAGGRLNCQWHTGRAEPAHLRSPTIADRYGQDADLGTVWLTDETLLKDVLGKGLSGSVVNPVAPTLDDLAFNAGFVRFPLDGKTMTINGNLSVSGACSRLEFGGSVATNWVVTGSFLRTREPWQLKVRGDITLGDGARLDIRSAMTNGVTGAGAVVSVGGALSLGGYTDEFATVGGSYYRVTNTSVVVWSDGYTGAAPRFEVGSMVVAPNAAVTAYRRGYFGGGSLQDAGCSDFPATGFGPAISNVVVGSKTYTLYGGGDCNDSGAYYGGGGHGGRGGFYLNKSAYRGQTYDDVLRPTMAGSGGGARYIQRTSLPGGGVIRVVAEGSICVDGVLCADGASYVAPSGKKLGYGNGGAGAGGSILLECQQLLGGGVLSACGGRNPTSTADNTKLYGGGGGGRIAVWTGMPYEPGQRTRRCTVSETPSALSDRGILFTGAANVSGGSSNRQDFPSLTGEDGTVRFVYNPPKRGMLMLMR